jgi:hypothetical protein
VTQFFLKGIFTAGFKIMRKKMWWISVLCNMLNVAETNAKQIEQCHILDSFNFFAAIHGIHATPPKSPPMPICTTHPQALINAHTSLLNGPAQAFELAVCTATYSL